MLSHFTPPCFATSAPSLQSFHGLKGGLLVGSLSATISIPRPDATVTRSSGLSETKRSRLFFLGILPYFHFTEGCHCIQVLTQMLNTISEMVAFLNPSEITHP